MTVDLTALTAIVMGMLVVLIPVAGFTLRFAIKPITEAVAMMREGSMERQKVDLLERRMTLLEQELHGLDGMREDLARVIEAADFQRELRASTHKELGR
jgi:hypothetical protein